jgi:SAM-dependent methyltransferase
LPNKSYGLEPSRADDYARMNLEVVRRRWDAKADRWDADLADPNCHLNYDEGYKRFLEIAETSIESRKNFCLSRTLVDVGCGTGAIIERFVDRFSDGLGIDISESMLNAARAKSIPRSRWVNANAFELSRHAVGVGTVLSRGILLSHYGPEWVEALMREICAALTPGGFMLLDFLNADARCNYAFNPHNKSYYRGEELIGFVKGIGFREGIILGEPHHRILYIFAERPS